MSEIEWHNEKRKLSELVPTDYNPRYLSDKQRNDLRNSLDKFNLAEIPAINTNNQIIAGHQRIKILSELKGIEHEIDVRIPNRELTDEELKEYLIRSNKNTGAWDWDDLGVYFEADELIEWGFTEGELFGNVELPEPDMDDLVDEEKGKDPVMKITFKDPEQLQKAETDIQELIDRKYEGAFYSVSAGEL